MGGHERPSNLVPKFGAGWLRFMIGFHIVLDCCGSGIEPETDVSGFGCLSCDIMTVWICRTKLVQVCEGTVRYPIRWVQDCDLIVVYGFYE